MIVAACPSCRENVTVPIDARPSSIVRCPLCSAECRLEQFLAQLPPPLIVLADADAPADAGEGLAEAPVEEVSDLADVAIDTGALPESGEHVPAFDFTPPAAEPVAGPREVARRPARRRTNAPWEVAKIVGGALLAVPAAQIILWWCVPYSWKRDLLNIGPVVSRVAPWIVPAKFHEPAEDRTELASTAGGESAADTSQQQSSQGRQWRSKLPTLGEPRTEPPADLAKSPSGMTFTEDNPSPAAAPAKPTERPPAAKPDVSGPAQPSEPAPAGQQAAQPEPAASGSVDTPRFTAADLQVALERAVQASVAWDTAPNQTPEDRAALTDEFYSAFANLGETVTFIARGEPGVRELSADVSELLSKLEQQPKKLVMIGNRTAQWLDQPARPNRGIFLFGTVSQVQPQGALFATELELAAQQKRTVSIFSRVDPTGFYAPGDHLLMLGALIADPAKNVPGYEGHAAEIVFGGFPVRLR